jgi:type II secretory pathway component PulK
MTLAVVAVTTAALAIVTTRVLHRSLAIERAASELQRRGALESCQRVILPMAEQILAAREKRLGTPVSEAATTLRIGDADLTIVVADEQAKFEVNTALTERGEDSCAAAVEDLLDHASANQKWAFRLTPISTDDPSLRRLVGFGQVFPDATPEQICAPGQDDLAPVALVTLWGSGAVNIARAPASVLRARLDGLCSAINIDRLASAREQNPKLKADEALRILQISERQRKTAARALTDHSECHSVRLSNHGESGSSFGLAVMDEVSDPRSPKSKPREIVSVYKW